MKPVSLLAATALLVIACASDAQLSSGEPAVQISAGDPHTCSVDAEGAVWCWGDISWDSPASGVHPSQVPLPEGLVFSSVDAGPGDACAISTEGDAWCWGLTPERRLLLGTDDPRQEDRFPAQMTLPGGMKFSSIASGWSHACAIATDGTAWCWGYNLFGQLGDGSTETSLTPVKVIMPGGQRLKAIAAGEQYTCAIAEEGSIWCWGYWYGFRLGPEFFDQPTPMKLTTPSDLRFSTISASSSFACALTEERAAWCWGTASAEVFGSGDSTSVDQVRPVQIPGEYTAIATGVGFVCALTSDGDAVCWGESVPPMTGFENDGYATPVPVLMPADRRFVAITAGGGHVCARAGDGSDWCWGGNSYGQLGDGTTVDRYEPVRAVLGSLGATPGTDSSADAPAILEWSGEAPVWPLGFAQTADALLGRTELPPACSRDAEKVREECLRTYFSERGVSDAALDLLFTYDISVFGVEGDGPVQVAWVWDWTNLGWNYYNANYIFTPEGILKELERSEWRAYGDALAEAGQLATFAKINEALPELGGVGFGAWGGQDTSFGIPEESPTGWTVPMTMRMSGCHACITPFAGRFAFDFTADGAAVTARFVDFCVYPYDPETATSEAFTSLAEELPACPPNTPYDGSVKASSGYLF